MFESVDDSGSCIEAVVLLLRAENEGSTKNVVRGEGKLMQRRMEKVLD